MRERERYVINCLAIRRGQSFTRNGRTGDVADCSRVSQSLHGAQNAGVGLTRLAQLSEAMERCDLAPVGLQDSLGQTGDRDPELVIRVVGEVLDAVVDQSHQCREFVGGSTEPGFQHGNDSLTEGQRVNREISHRS